MSGSGVGVPAGTPTAHALATRITGVDQDLTQLDTAICQRQTHLWQLAHQVGAFVDEQAALARAQATIRDADQRPACYRPTRP